MDIHIFVLLITIGVTIAQKGENVVDMDGDTDLSELIIRTKVWSTNQQGGVGGQGGNGTGPGGNGNGNLVPSDANCACFKKIAENFLAGLDAQNQLLVSKLDDLVGAVLAGKGNGNNVNGGTTSKPPPRDETTTTAPIPSDILTTRNPDLPIQQTEAECLPAHIVDRQPAPIPVSMQRVMTSKPTLSERCTHGPNGRFCGLYLVGPKDEPATWWETHEWCKRYGARMIAVRDQEELDFLPELIENRAWLWTWKTVGEVTSENRPEWCSSHHTGLVNFVDGEPNNWGGPELCIELFPRRERRKGEKNMNDEACRTKRQMMCVIRDGKPAPEVAGANCLPQVIQRGKNCS